MLTPVQKDAFHLFKFFYGYLQPYPVAWDANFTTLVAKKSLKSWLTNLLFVGNIIWVGLANFFVIWKHFYIRPIKHFDLDHVFALAFNGTATTILCVVILMLFIKRDEWLAGFNGIYQMDVKMTKGRF